MRYDAETLRYISQRLTYRHLRLIQLIGRSDPKGINKDDLLKACARYRGLSRPVVDAHVLALYTAGLIRTVPDGRQIVYHLDDNGSAMAEVLVVDGLLTKDGDLVGVTEEEEE